MERINEQYRKARRPVKVLQFGEGNFLRAFADYMIDAANEAGVFDGSVAMVKPRPGSVEKYLRQDYLYTVLLRGKRDGETVDESRVITCIDTALDCGAQYGELLALARLDTLEFVLSNTTEAGIALDDGDRFDGEPPNSFPAKLTRVLYERYRAFSGDASKGLAIIPTELVEDNGGKLRGFVLELAARWGLEDGFAAWVDSACAFCSTLVDRIVTGYPAADAEELARRLGYSDELMVAAEPFGLWVIEGPDWLAERFPLHKAGQPVLFTGDASPYRERKVRILNGAHTSMALAAYLAGCDTVLDCMGNPAVRGFLEGAVRDEILPVVPLPREEKDAFARAVFERFENPFVQHSLLSIAMNSVSKWRARLLPTLRDFFAANGTVPPRVCFSFAALLRFYTGRMENGLYLGDRSGESYEIRDSSDVLERFASLCSKPPEDYVRAIAADSSLWGEDLTLYSGFVERVADGLVRLQTEAVEDVLKSI